MPGCVVRAPPNGKRWSLCRWQYVVIMVRRQRYEESNAASLPYDSRVCPLLHVIIVDNGMAKRDKPDCLPELLSVHWETTYTNNIRPWEESEDFLSSVLLFLQLVF